MSNDEYTENDEVLDMIRALHEKATRADDMYVSIVFREPEPERDRLPREIQIDRYKLPRVGEYITWNDWPYNTSRVIAVHHDFPSHTSIHAHVVTLHVEDMPEGFRVITDA